ncbi:hypothetical protein MTR_6g452920 [Medicago truncatula]|uniref:Uncharacterized protein n=1 Tax=Medicago truncatula TaxID=3880 RepID=A0A072U9I8_MEDTR|nr:hypothetical protein MTR_6g452920 [Medicago truncatula]
MAERNHMFDELRDHSIQAQNKMHNLANKHRQKETAYKSQSFPLFKYPYIYR